MRKLGRSIIQPTKIRGYLLYAAGEITLVVIGILIAVQVNDWNENRKKERVKQRYVSALIDDLKRDTVMLNQVERVQMKHIKQLDEFKKRLSDPDASADTLLKIVRMEVSPAIAFLEHFNNSTYESLTTTGDIELFDSALRQKLNRLRASQVNALEADANNKQVYMEQINAYVMRFPIGQDPNNLIVSGPLYDAIWEEVDIASLAARFNGMMGSKRAVEGYSLNNLREVRGETVALLQLLQVRQ